ncbi:MAG: 4Fe-4S dicluster domain-containing protein [Planctomycetota bacterium]
MRLLVLQPDPDDAGGDSTPWPRQAPGPPAMSRRSFLRQGTAAAGGLAALAAAASPLARLVREDHDYFDNFFQKHYKEMSPQEIEAVLERIADEVEQRFGKRPDIRDVRPTPGVEFVYALNVSRCNGNRRCVHACVAENNQSRDPELQYIRVVEMPRGTIDLDHGNHHYDRDMVPDRDHYYLPIQCHQCANPPCVKVCPVEATWQEADGITVIDYDWCIGCPDMSYLSNRPRTVGVMEKCTFCLHRTREGRLPACLEACPTGARKFGNVLDPTSEVAQILRKKRVFVLKEDVGTMPRFFYYFDERHGRERPTPTEGAGAAGVGE